VPLASVGPLERRMHDTVARTAPTGARKPKPWIRILSVHAEAYGMGYPNG
jgi:hypothetical protein